MKKGDFFVFGIIAALSVLLFAVTAPRENGKTVVIKENGETVYSARLSLDKTVELSGNTVEISNGRVKMKSADCKNQICVHHTAISRKGETVICLPNRVSVTVE